MHSIVLLLRTLVVLAFLVAVPAAAICWTPVSQTLNRFSDRWSGRTTDPWTLQEDSSQGQNAQAPTGPSVYVPPSGDDTATAWISGPAIDAASSPLAAAPSAPGGVPPIPEFGAAPPAAISQSAIPNAAQPAAPGNAGQPGQNISAWSRNAPGGNVPASYATPSGGVAPQPAGPLVAMGRGGESAAPLNGSALSNNAAPGPQAPTRAPTVADTPGHEVGQQPDVQAWLSRLKQLGAAYYRLDRQQGQYRFHCDVLVGAETQATQGFEVVADEPRRAIYETLTQVEQFRGERR